MFLQSSPTARIELSGHTDSTGDKKSNQLLSEHRAKSVYDYLIKQGIDSKRLEYKGFGDSKAIASNDSESGRALNRRTEFKIISL